MTYAEAVQNLVDAGSKAGISIIVSIPEYGVDRVVFGNDLAQEIETVGYPAGAELPWVVEDFYLYSLDEITERQAGYRYDAHTGEASQGWDQNQYVIADWTANPLTLGVDGAIRYARHGQEEWTYVRIAPDVPSFFALLADWLRYFVVERAGNLFNEDFQIDEATRDIIRNSILRPIDLDDREAALAFLLGE